MVEGKAEVMADQRKLRRLGNPKVCPICAHRDGTFPDTYANRIARHSTKTVCPEGCPSSPHRHKHMKCGRCDGEWLQCWDEDRVPLVARWWHWLAHWGEQIHREHKEIGMPE